MVSANTVLRVVASDEIGNTHARARSHAASSAGNARKFQPP
ncbi:MAG TPA: hypothetical protein VI136_14015 [Verrucomicrobiae bacterium]